MMQDGPYRDLGAACEQIKRLEKMNTELREENSTYKKEGYILTSVRKMGFRAAYLTSLAATAATVLLCLANDVSTLGTVGGSVLLGGSLLGVVRMVDVFTRNLE